MSSSSDAHTQHDVASSSSNFHQHFRQCINALQNQIDSLSAPDVAAEGRKATTESILAGITKLSATLADASSDLPSYDQRSYNQVGLLLDQICCYHAATLCDSNEHTGRTESFPAYILCVAAPIWLNN